ncbi:transposase [Streptomyces fuscichromogenes]|uniref:Mutator family transposase n=1 Tax=Streptomyces fuscichromogenes TaxID=1324013 RepID=A0A918CTN5_9ACTN|nr:transposase [Streptomyces fuscichromogenes]GGN22303.1 IS256 family transposase [Streptomyces fuscichromogenes]
MLSVVTDDGSTQSGSLIDEIVREGARRMLAAALEAEVDQYIAELAAETDDHERRLVVRNGRHLPRTVVTAAGPVKVRAPRVNDRRVDGATGERKRFSSRILPRWCRKSPKVSEVLPLLYQHGLSSGDSGPALEQFLGSAADLSPATVTWLTRQWSDDHAPFQDRELSQTDYVYVWAEGLSESTESWADLLRDCRRRRMGDPELVVGDGAMGLWRALAEAFPAARHQRCWAHKARNVTNCLPKSAQPGATKANLRTTNPIESTFSTVKSRTKVTRGAGSPAAALAMVFKLVESAQARRRAITGAHLVPLVSAGARFENGVLIAREGTAA